jgi:hypothetical protein
MAHPPLEPRELDAAVAAGIFDAETRQRLVEFAAAWRDGRGAAYVAGAGVTGPDEEQFRLLTGFNDIFVAIAIGILLWAVGAIGSMGTTVPGGEPLLAGLAVAATAWGLAEYFTRKRRMALPSIELLVAFVGGVYAASFGLILLLAGKLSASPLSVADGDLSKSMGNVVVIVLMLLPAGIAIAAAVAHWRRFRVPITLAAGCAILILPTLALLTSTAGASSALIFSLLSGIAVFLLAMRIDASDRARLTRRTDIAFWLHLLAAPLIAHPMLSQLQASASRAEAWLAAIGTVGLYLALCFVALAIDRRALLVSGLAYVIYALGAVLSSGADPGSGFTITALIVGGSLVLLSAAWARARSAVAAVLPGNIRALVPPVV